MQCSFQCLIHLYLIIILILILLLIIMIMGVLFFAVRSSNSNVCNVYLQLNEIMIYILCAVKIV
ncbi:unnamed protein product [Schistosoma margrebowiei]|uniref:Uncharacterized protein n=1 Tax=Schistosoma margrebowiei TaxID=48269 RepID=A0A3P7VLX9_9TREM|nr:unnamed protein product [Schistosoma margrebowiei]